MSDNLKVLLQMYRIFFGHKEVVLYLGIAAGAIAISWGQADLQRWVMLFGIGWILYLFQEYVSHIAVFHGPIPQQRYLYRMLYRLHLGHHDKPKRLDLLFTPVWYTLPMLIVNSAVYWALTGSVIDTSAMTAGLVTGYLLFEWWHLVVHSPYQPGPVLSYIRRQHMGHHYWNERRWYIISPPAVVLDLLFRSGGKVEQAPKSEDPMRSGVEESDPRLVAARQFYSGGSDWTEEESAIWRKHSRKAA